MRVSTSAPRAWAYQAAARVASFEVGVLSPAPTSERDRRAGRLLRGDPPFDETNVRWRGPEFGIGDKFGLDQLDDPAPSLDRARPRGKDVLHPLHV
jgi:hypothetical protein